MQLPTQGAPSPTRSAASRRTVLMSGLQPRVFSKRYSAPPHSTRPRRAGTKPHRPLCASLSTVSGGENCSFDNNRPGSKDKDGDDESQPRTEPAQSSILDRLGGPVDIQQHVRIYFANFHPEWPFLHRATFSVEHEPALLLYSVVMIGLWASGEDANRQMALDLHRWLGTCIREQQTTWEYLPNQSDTLSSAWPIATYQGILLYLIFSLIIAPQQARPLTLRIPLFTPDYQILTALMEEDRAKLLRLSDLQFPEPNSNHLWEARSNPELSYLLEGIRRDADPGRSQSRRWISECEELLGGWGLE
ncbi:transcription factor with C2H2 and Zn(2)-Cys(6) DNA binding domain [Aspergillus affinis]|uniref:transcription factor with C2H2 and Zn(2)-Cys(6) DNA binding domain n=1 Tax=Aspergillus affinis TaxID=1070780 RepID=UPI0022FE1BAF|nr:transcription factor with C2H2 and Zn(2)-Cys(6) DNA binding domain [Aspergillus affinis]KAI9045008.1 transcription factor with C2H2 and Zn(2)-Cys(6) DNA binding domain [Aspergillus affinis]